MEAHRKKAVRVLKKKECPYGILCWFGALGCCNGKHSKKDYLHFDRKATMRKIEAELRCEEAKAPCAWCRRGCRRFGTTCRKGLMVDNEYESEEDDAMEEEATVKEELIRGTVENSASQCASAGRRRPERQREALVMRQEFEGKREKESTVEKLYNEVVDEFGEERGYEGIYTVLMTSDEDMRMKN